MRVACAAVAVLIGGTVTAAAEEVPRAWTLAAEPAWGRTHDDDEAAAGSLRVFRALDRGGRWRAQAGLTVSSYGTLDLGIEARLCRSCRVSPVLGVGGGLMGEGEYDGLTFARATAGIEAVLAPRLVLRATVQVGTHDGQAGPHLRGDRSGLAVLTARRGAPVSPRPRTGPSDRDARRPGARAAGAWPPAALPPGRATAAGAAVGTARR